MKKVVKLTLLLFIILNFLPSILFSENASQKDESPEMVIQIGHQPGWALAISSDGNYFITNNTGYWVTNEVKLWRKDGKLLRIIKTPLERVQAVAISPDGQYLVCGGQVNTYAAEDYKSAYIYDFYGNLVRVLDGSICNVRSIAYTGTGDKILCSGDGAASGVVDIWSAGGNLINSIQINYEEYEKYGINSRISKNGNYIIITDRAGNMVLTDLAGKTIKVFQDDRCPGRPGLYAFSPHQQYILAVNFIEAPVQEEAIMDMYCSLNLWDMNGKLVKVLEERTDYVESVAFSPDGNIYVLYRKEKHIYAGRITYNTQSGVIKVYNIAGQIIDTIESQLGPITNIAFSQADLYIATFEQGFEFRDYTNNLVNNPHQRWGLDVPL